MTDSKTHQIGYIHAIQAQGTFNSESRERTFSTSFHRQVEITPELEGQAAHLVAEILKLDDLQISVLLRP